MNNVVFRDSTPLIIRWAGLVCRIKPQPHSPDEAEVLLVNLLRIRSMFLFIIFAYLE